MTDTPQPDKPAERCQHDRLDEEGICRRCGADMRTGTDMSGPAPEAPAPQVMAQLSYRGESYESHATYREESRQGHEPVPVKAGYSPEQAPAPQVEEWMRAAAKELQALYGTVIMEAPEYVPSLEEGIEIITKHCPKGAK